MEHERLRLTASTDRRPRLGVDPGLSGGMALVDGDRVAWAVEWEHGADGATVTHHSGRTFKGPTLAAAMERFVAAFSTMADSPVCGGTPATVELTNIYGPKAGVGDLLKTTGYIRCWLDVMGCIREDEPQQTTWVADVLACPPKESDAGVLAALRGEPLPGSRRIVEWNLSGDAVDRIAEPTKRGRKRFGKHAGDAIGLALQGSGRRLTRAPRDCDRWVDAIGEMKVGGAA
jgi:hypothetical protein